MLCSEKRKGVSTFESLHTFEMHSQNNSMIKDGEIYIGQILASRTSHAREICICVKHGDFLHLVSKCNCQVGTCV